MTAGTGGTPYTTTLEGLRNAKVFNQGVGGETSTQIRARFDVTPLLWSLYTIFWEGRNNFLDPTTVKADIAAQVAELTTTKYVVLSVLNQNTSNEWSGQPDYVTLTTLNSDLATTYAGHYVDVRAALVAAFNPALPQDVIDHGHDVPPTSLRFDNIHLNTAGYTIVANQVNAYITAHP